MHRYFLKPKSYLEERLKAAEEGCQKQAAELSKNREKIVKDLRAVETEIKELLGADTALGQEVLGAVSPELSWGPAQLLKPFSLALSCITHAAF